MPRNATNGKWYIPLVAGVEVASRSGGITTYDPGTLVGTLPAAPPWALPGLVLWLDGAATSTTRTMPDGKVWRWDDRSGQNNHATQPVRARQPLLSGLTVQF